MKTTSTSYKLPIVILIITIFLPVYTFCQSKTPGSVEYLKYSNGLNGLVLGTDIHSLTNYSLTYLDGNSRPDADSCITYACKDSAMLKMGDSLDLEMVGIRTYKGNIVNIYLFFKRPESYKILSDFLTAYGNYTDKPDEYKDIYNWNSSAVSLSLMYEAKVDLGVAVFTCNRLSATVAANDKLRSSKIESLALSALPFSMPQTAGLGSK